MSKAKRTITFILAVVTCMTFCLVNGNALTDRYFFYGTSMTANFFYGSNANPSFARVTITNWGDAEEVNDLTASTYGYNDNTVDGVDNDYLLEAYARVYIYFDDGIERSLDNTVLGTNTQYEVVAEVCGASLDHEDISVIDFDTDMELYYIHVVDGDPVNFDFETSLYEYEKYGNTISICTRD